MLLADVRYALRALARSRTFTITAILTLALGISVNTAIVSVIDSVLLTPPPFDTPDRVVTIDGSNSQQGAQITSVAYPDVLDWRASTHAFAEIAVYRHQTYNVAGDDRAERARGARVSANFFRVFGVAPQFGRAFLPAETTPGNDRVLVLSDGYWRRRFAASPSVVGQQLSINGTPYTIVGVMPRYFAYPPTAEVWSPLAADEDLMKRGARYISAVGRLAPRATVEQGVTELNAVAARLESMYPASNTGWRTSVRPIEVALVGRMSPILYTFLGAVGFVLLIACANVANLLLARASGRAREIAIRTALGASRWRLVRQLLTESVVLALGGAMVGVLLALWEVRLLKAIVPLPLPPWISIEVSGRALVVTVLLALVTGIVAGIAPALRLAWHGVRQSLATGVRGSGTARRSRTQRGLVVAEVALAVVLLAGAGLLLASFARLAAVSPGFSADGVLTARLTLAGPRYATGDALVQFYDRVLERLRATPGVQAAGAAGALPLSGSTNTSNFHIPGREEPADGQGPVSRWERVTPDYFRTLAIPVRSGREFEATDRSDARPVIVVNEAFAGTFFPGERDVVGRLVQLGGSDTQSEIVGVVGDVRHDGLDEPARPTLFLPYAQHADGGMTIVVRGSGDPAVFTSAIRDAVRAVDASIPVYDVATLRDQVSRSILAQRLSGGMIGVFAMMALLLSAVGVYGLIGYTVAARRHEIGIRIALGAQRRDVHRLVVGQGVRLAVVGVLVGLVGAVIIARAMRRMLYGVSAVHVPTLVGVTLTLIAVAAVASWIPARRAARADPLNALRGD